MGCQSNLQQRSSNTQWIGQPHCRLLNQPATYTTCPKRGFTLPLDTRHILFFLPLWLWCTWKPQRHATYTSRQYSLNFCPKTSSETQRSRSPQKEGEVWRKEERATRQGPSLQPHKSTLNPLVSSLVNRTGEEVEGSESNQGPIRHTTHQKWEKWTKSSGGRRAIKCVLWGNMVITKRPLIY